jgi:hypothetical protein
VLFIVLGVVGFLALSIGACTVWFVSTVKAPVDTSNRFLAAIDAGDYDAAVAFTDPTCSLGVTAADFAGFFSGADIDYDLNSSNVSNSRATVSGSFRIDDIEQAGITLSLRKVDSEWRVCGFNLS